MERVCIDDLYDILGHIISEKEGFSVVYNMYGGKIVKIFDYRYLERLLSDGIDIENKIISSSPIDSIPEIIVPSDVIYDSNGNFCGYTMESADGINFDNYISIMKSGRYSYNFNLNDFNEQFCLLEDIVMRSNNIVFPNLMDSGNILYGSTFSLIDYDCIQINDFLSPKLSDYLGDRSKYYNTKYMNGNFYTKELDIKSLIHLYFMVVYNCDLNKVDKCSIEYVFNKLGINNNILYDRVMRLYDDSLNNLCLGGCLSNIDSDDSFGKTLIKKL